WRRADCGGTIAHPSHFLSPPTGDSNEIPQDPGSPGHSVGLGGRDGRRERRHQPVAHGPGLRSRYPHGELLQAVPADDRGREGQRDPPGRRHRPGQGRAERAALRDRRQGGRDHRFVHHAGGRCDGRHRRRVRHRAAVGLPPGKDAWTFRLPQSNTVMAHAMINHMQKQGVKTVGFLGYTDVYGEQWLKEFTPLAEKAGIKVVAVERFARADTSVTPQALKLVAANPDAMLVVASGSGAAMPEMGILDRGYKGKIYQTHAAATRDLMRVGGKAVEGTYVVP